MIKGQTVKGFHQHLRNHLLSQNQFVQRQANYFMGVMDQIYQSIKPAKQYFLKTFQLNHQQATKEVLEK